MTAFVIRGLPAILVRHAQRFLFRPRHYAHNRFLDHFQRNALFIPARGEQSRLVHQVHQIRAGEIRGLLCDAVKISRRPPEACSLHECAEPLHDRPHQDN